MTDIVYIHRCLQLARYGEGFVSPNPMVGAVIVHNNTIIGEGYHQGYGLPHAEPNAINSVKDKSLLQQSTLYVSLEPCSHYGKTPPCADLIIQHKIPRVVIGMQDPNPKVAGNGIKKLRDAGIQVVVGVLEDECRELNRRFITFFEKERPYITLKWAQTQDGFIDKERLSASESGLKISNELTRILVHKLRAENQAILVGTNTALLDNPSLNVRYWQGKSPVRLVVDRAGKIPPDYNIFNGQTKTIIFAEKSNKFYNENIEHCVVDLEDDLIEKIIRISYEKGINSILVEGGANLLQQFIDKKLWDEAQVEIAPFEIEKGVKAPVMEKLPCEQKICDNHQIYTFRNKNNN